jgi:hypothetical protein
MRVFADSRAAVGVASRQVFQRLPSSDDAGEFISAAELVPTVDWDALTKASGIHVAASREDPETVDAYLYLLADGFGVYLEAVEGPSIYVVEMESGTRPRLRSVRTRSISQGDYIVLRSTGGSGDYIPEIADRFLGRRAAALRDRQREWKSLLREKIRERGRILVERDLRSLGVTYPNLQYRLLHQSIRTREPNDFRLLMEYIGLGKRSGELWVAMSEIHEAHVRAGQQVRHLLEEAVLNADTEQLIRTGRIDVSLSEIDAGTLSVFRVLDRAPAITSVADEDLRKVQRIGADLWQG